MVTCSRNVHLLQIIPFRSDFPLGTRSTWTWDSLTFDRDTEVAQTQSAAWVFLGSDGTTLCFPSARIQTTRTVYFLSFSLCQLYLWHVFARPQFSDRILCSRDIVLESMLWLTLLSQNMTYQYIVHSYLRHVQRIYQRRSNEWSAIIFGGNELLF